jgi:hypothetical protein
LPRQWSGNDRQQTSAAPLDHVGNIGKVQGTSARLCDVSTDPGWQNKTTVLFGHRTPARPAGPRPPPPRRTRRGRKLTDADCPRLTGPREAHEDANLGAADPRQQRSFRQGFSRRKQLTRRQVGFLFTTSGTESMFDLCSRRQRRSARSLSNHGDDIGEQPRIRARGDRRR